MRKVALLASLLAFSALTTWWFASDGPDSSPAAARTATSKSLGATAALPDEWHSLTGDPSTLLLAATEVSKGNPQGDECGWGPGIRYVVYLSVNEVEPGLDTDSAYPRRPTRFGPRSGTGLFQDAPDECGEHQQRIRFSERGRRFVAALRFEALAPSDRRSEAYVILNSLRISRPTADREADLSATGASGHPSGAAPPPANPGPDLGSFKDAASLVAALRSSGPLNNEEPATVAAARAPDRSICADIVANREPTAGTLVHQALAAIEGEHPGVVLVLRREDGSREVRLYSTGDADATTGGCRLIFASRL